MFYREMQDNENMNMENDNMPNPQQMPYGNQMGPQEINQQQMPMGETCPYMNQGMYTNPDMMYQ